MKPKLKISLAAAALVCGTAFATAYAVQQEKPAAGGAPPGFDPAMMQKMMELAAPGKEHEALAKLAGNWEQKLKFRLGPDMPWSESTGTSTIKPVLGGRYIVEDTQSSMMGMPMQGMLMLGYDKMKGEYVSLWADSMSTWWVTSRGKAGADGSVDLKGTMIDMAGERPFRMLVKHMSDDLTEIEMYDTIPPKGDTLVMTITSKRKK